jgi:hypothetical protein
MAAKSGPLMLFLEPADLGRNRRRAGFDPSVAIFIARQSWGRARETLRSNSPITSRAIKAKAVDGISSPSGLPADISNNKEGMWSNLSRSFSARGLPYYLDGVDTSIGKKCAIRGQGDWIRYWASNSESGNLLPSSVGVVFRFCSVLGARRKPSPLNDAKYNHRSYDVGRID